MRAPDTQKRNIMYYEYYAKSLTVLITDLVDRWINQSRTCTYQGGCPKRATHGIPGVHDHKSAPLCGNHALEGMEDVVSKRCAEPGCNVRNPRFGEPGARKNVRREEK